MRAALAASLVACTLALPTTWGGHDAGIAEPGGRILRPGDLDVWPTLARLPAQPCYADADGDSAYDPGEPVYLDVREAVCRSDVGVLDVRLTPAGSYPAGSRVAAGDADHQDHLETDIIGARYGSGGGAGESFGPGAALYLDADADGTASAGDVRLTAHGTRAPGTVVRAGDPDAGEALRTAFEDADVAYWDLDGDGGFGAGDPAILDGGEEDLLDWGDVHLTPPVSPYGTIETMRFVRPVLAGMSLAFCYSNEDKDMVFDVGEPIYLRLTKGDCKGNVTAGDLRLTGNGSYAAWTVPRSVDADFNGPLEGFPGTVALRHHDQDADGLFGPGDALFLDVANNGRVDAGDARLTAFGALPTGGQVRADDPDAGLPLAKALFDAGKFAALDWGGGPFGAGDVLYLDRDDDGKPEVNDVRLTPLSVNAAVHAIGHVEDEGDGDGEDMPTEGEPPEEDPDPEPQDEAVDEEPAEEPERESRGSPAPGLGLALAGLALLLWRRR